MTKWLTVLAMASMCAACGGAPSGERFAESPRESVEETPAAAPAIDVPQYREVTIPAGTTLRLELQSAIASDSSRVEDAVRAELREAIAVDGREVLAAGAEVLGTVTDVERSGRVSGRARVVFHFNSVTTARDEYDIRTEPVARQAEATKGEDATKIGVGAGIGAAIGGLLGGGDGAAKGAAIGGAGGTGVVLATRGEEVRLGPGANVTARLAAPLVVRVRVS